MAEEAPDYAGIVARAARGEYAHRASPTPVPPTRDVLSTVRERPRSPYDRFRVKGKYGMETFVPPMPRDDALAVLRAMGTDSEWDDQEMNHDIADRLLVMLLADDAITEAYESIAKWYS